MNVAKEFTRPTEKVSDRSLLRVVGFLAFFFLAVLLAVKGELLSGLSQGSLCVAATALLGAAMGCLICSSTRGIWSITTVFLTVFALFHFGLIILYAFGLGVPPVFALYLKKWWYSDQARYAIVLVCTGLCAFVAGACLALFLPARQALEVEDDVPETRLARLGCLLVAGFGGAWVLKILWYGGAGMLTGSYQEYLAGSQGFMTEWYYSFFTGLGLLFLAASPPSGWRKAGIAAFCLWSAFALALGLRGEIMFPTLTALAVAGMKRPPLSWQKTLVLGLCLLAVISGIKQIRQVGLAEVQARQVTFFPTDGLAEMGSSIRPVAEVVSWDRKGEAFIRGASYWAPLDRSLIYFIPGWTRPPVKEDDRLLGNLIGRRVGSVGFSMVAEAHRNFGAAGVLLALMLVGFLLGRIELWPPTWRRQLTAGVILLPLLVEVRNSFISVPINMGIGLIFVYLAGRWLGAGGSGPVVSRQEGAGG